jgi:outer membrane protein insertion porin family
MILPIFKKQILSVFFLITSVFAQTIREIEISGNIQFSNSEYLNWMGIGSGSTIYQGLADSIYTRISENLTDRGYLEFSLDSLDIRYNSDSQYVFLNIFLNEGKPTLIRNIIFDNLVTKDSSEILNRFQYLNGLPLDKYEIEKGITEILNFYENKSFPFASVKIQSIFIFEDSTNGNVSSLADLYFEIDNGPPSKVDSILIRGNDKTKDYVIIRSLRIDTGSVYIQRKIEEIPKRLNRLRFFEPVELPTFYFDNNNKGILQITVREKQTNNFDGIVGYLPGRSETEKGYFTGFVNISLRNLFGTGRAAAVKWEQLDRNSQLLELKFLEPWVLGFPFNIQLGLFQRKQDTTYVQRRFNGSLDYLATEELSASLLLSTESTIPTTTSNNSFSVFNSTIYTIGGNVRYDSRDDIYAPTEGVLFQTSYSYSNKKIHNNYANSVDIPKNVSLQRIEADFGIFLQFLSRQVIALSLHAREMRGDLFEVSDLYRLGGNNTLRGYREDQFLGNRILWSNFEYRFSLATRTYLFTFFDLGYYLRAADPSNSIIRNNDWKYGFGFGVNLETGLGVLGVSYALGEGDSFNNGKIHFGLLNDF